jgi:uncharacterized repeat protein (TIGR02543 family)
MKSRVLHCFVFMLFISLSLSAKTYYVSAAGNNNNSGLTASTPWQTISKVNSLFASMAAGDSILFRRGDVFYGTLVIGRSGTSTLPMTIGAYGTGAKPVISGFLNVSSWSLVSNGVYQASVNAKGTLNMVTIDNVPQAIGRYPNDNAANGGYLNYESFTSSTITDNEMDGGINWAGAEIAIRKKLWVIDRCRITANAGSVYTFTNINSTYEGTAGFGYFIQNDPRTLDKFGEWYFNSTSKNLQVYFGDASPSSYTIKASGIDTLLYMTSKSYINVDNIAFDGANANAFIAVSSSFINVKNCDFTNAGTGAITGSVVSNFLVENCTTNNILSNAILINSTRGSNITVRGCSVRRTGCLPGMGMSSGNSYKGIMASVSSGLMIEYNRVDTSGYVGIEFQGSNVTVRNNVVNYFDFIKDDAGGIYTYTSSSDAVPGTIYTNRVVRDNIVMNGAGAPYGRNSSNLFVSGIYLDGRTMNVDVLNNTVFNNGKNGIHCNNPQNVNIKGNTSYNNLNAMSAMRWANLGEIRGLTIKNNIFYPKTEAQRNFYYSNSALNEPVNTAVNEAMRLLGTIDSNYYSTSNAAGFLQEIYATTAGALVPTSPLSLEGWRTNTLHDTASRKPVKSPISYKINSLVGTNKFTNGLFSSSVSGITVFGTGTTGVWDNTGKISGGSLMISFSAPTANKYSLVYSPIGAVSSSKKYLLRFSTYGTKQQGVIRAYIRKTTSPYTSLTPVQVKSFGTGRRDHEFLFSAPTTDAGGSFVIEIEQNSGTTYLDNIDFYEATAQLYDYNSQLRFEYNDTKLAKTVSLDGRYTAVDGTVYTTSLTLQPFTSVILVKDTGTVALAATATATVIKCFGDSATVTVAATGGTQPYTGTGTFKVIAGTYTYAVTDAGGMVSSTTVTISQPAAPLSVSATAGTIAVAGGTTTVTVSASGGTAPYTGIGTFTVSAGTYTQAVTDANGCISSITGTIADGAGPFTINISSSPTAGGSTTGAGTYTAGATATLTAAPAAGYVFSGWSGDVTGTASTIEVTMNANKVVTATFAPITYSLTVTVTPTIGGTVTGAGTYNSGTAATLTATPASGYTFAGWSGDVTGTASGISVTMTSNKSVTATFVPITYTLTATVTPAAGGTVTGTGTFASGTNATLTATPAAGYVFSGWSGAATGTASTVTVSMTSNKTVTATFTAAPVTYTLTATVTPTAGGTVTGTGTYASGATATLTATPAAGYVFSGWSGAVTGTTATVTVSMTSNKAVTATFTQAQYTMRTAVLPNSTTGRAIGAGTYLSGATATLTAIPSAGYVFSGWSGDVTGTATTIAVTMNANMLVTATFVPITYTLTATATPTIGGTVTGAGTYNSGTTATLTATPAAGYVFNGWSGDTTGTAATITLLMTSNKSVTATFVPITYTLAATVTPAAGGTVTGTGTYASGTTATLTATPAAGYVFSGWSGAATGTASTVTVSMTSNKTVTATFTAVIVTYTLAATITPTAGGTVTGTGTYNSGTTATLTATPAAGYTFTGWSGAATGTAATVTVSMTSNRTVTATFVPITYTLTATVTPTAGGTVTGTGTYNSGTTATLTATPAAGYTFSGWSGDVSGTNASITVVMTSNRTVTATFVPITYTLTATVTPTAGGTVTGTGTYNSGTTATLTATPAAGYTFSGWSGAATGTTSTVTVSMTSDKTVTATFTQIQYTMRTAVLTNSTTGRITGAGNYLSGATATITAIPSAGYIFTGWGGDATGTSLTTNVVMTADKLVTASFVPIVTNYDLTVTASPTEGGTVSGAGTYSSNTLATVIANTAAGYTFTGWTGDTAAADTSITLLMNANKTITANFVANTTLRFEDDAIGVTGLCSIQSSVSNNSGANNGRSINLTNTIARGLDYNVVAGAAGTYNLKWRYANGSTSNTFYMQLIINGEIVDDSVPFPRTTGSSTFALSSGNFQLQAGNNTVRLESITNRATADIDWMEVTGYAPAIGSCSQVGTKPAAQTTETTTSEVITSRTNGVYPNPAKGRINIAYELPEAQKVTFIILDAAGNPVGELKGQFSPAGFNTQVYNMTGKAAGVYTVMLIGEKGVRKAYKFIVIQ